MKRLAIIPARAGSKGLKDKNIIDLCGKPLLAYSIEAGIETDLFEKVLVSTDSEKYAEIAIRHGAVAMMRNELLAHDNASTYVVIEDVLQREKTKYDYFVLLQPTSPMRDSHHVKEAIQQFEDNYDKFDNSLKYFDTDFSNYTRQKYKEYSPNGAIFIGKCAEYLERRHFFGTRSIAYKMNLFDSIDIDTELDYEFACLCMRKKIKQICKFN